MPDPERLLNTLRLATQGVRQTPGRRGHLVNLEAAGEVMVAGDLHGNLDNFRRLLDAAQLAQNPKRHLILQELIHGLYRYPAGGDKSHQLVDLAAALACQFPGRVHYLLGNHELSQWTGRAIARGDVDFNALFREGVGTAYGAEAAAVYQAYGELFATLPLAIRTPNRICLSHSAPNSVRMSAVTPEAFEHDPWADTDLRPGGIAHSITWGTDTRQENIRDYLRRMDADLLVTGHIPCDGGFATPSEVQIILDSMGSPACCCLFTVDRPLSQADLLQGIINL